MHIKGRGDGRVEVKELCGKEREQGSDVFPCFFLAAKKTYSMVLLIYLSDTNRGDQQTHVSGTIQANS